MINVIYASVQWTVIINIFCTLFLEMDIYM